MPRARIELLDASQPHDGGLGAVRRALRSTVLSSSLRRALLPGLPVVAQAGRPLHVRTRVHNLSTRPYPAQATYGRRLVRLGAQLYGENGTLLDRDFARAWLPQTLSPGARADVPDRNPDAAAGRTLLAEV